MQRETVAAVLLLVERMAMGGEEVEGVDDGMFEVEAGVGE